MENIKVLFAIYALLIIISAVVGISVWAIFPEAGILTAAIMAIISSILTLYMLYSIGKGVK